MKLEDIKSVLMFIDVAVSRGVVRGDELEAVAMIRRKVVEAIEAEQPSEPEILPAN